MRTLLFAILLLLAACSRAPATAAQAKAGDLDVQLGVEPDPPITGENHLLVTLRDGDKPVDGATLALDVDMPAMGAMPEMKAQGAPTALGNGRYSLAYPLAMQGDWFLSLSVEAAGHPKSLTRLKISTTRRGFTVEGAGGHVAHAIEVPPGRQQLIGVAFAKVEERPLTARLRAAGRVEVDERKLADVTLKYEAYAQRLLVAETGKAVRAGEPLLIVYSPDLLAAEEQLLTARTSGAAHEIVTAAERRLAQWDLSADQIAAVEKAGKADGKLTISAPAAGVVLEKDVVEGARIMAGTNLYRIGNLGHVWVQAAVYERDAPWVTVGLPARVSLPAMPSKVTEAKVTFVAPTVDEKTRTLGARVELVNPELALKPGMFADVEVEAPLGTHLAVPESALLVSGEHRYAFVDRGGGRLEAVEVQVGARSDGFVEVKSGLEAGQQVATQATFLLSSEAKLRDQLPQWGAP